MDNENPFSDALRRALARHGGPAPVLPFDLRETPIHVFDLSGDNEDLATIDVGDSAAYSAYITETMRRHGAVIGVGRYGEHRPGYARRVLFASGHQPRTLHLGIDLWAPAGTKVSSPLPASVHSSADNAGRGDYGPTVILQHRLGHLTFFTLYGHLSPESLEGKHIGRSVGAGEVFAAIGAPPGNGDWAPHLHFQLITDMAGHFGDYPGVAPAADGDGWLARSPDPRGLLMLEGRL